jgi:hypothetical protein
MASAGSLIFELAADVSRLRTDMQAAQREVKSSLASIAKSSAATAVMVGAQFAMSFARGFASSIQAAIDQGDAFGKLAQRIGTTTEAFSGLAYAGQFASVSADDLTNAFKGLNKAFIDAENPASTAAIAFQALGLNFRDLKAEDPATAFTQIAQKISGFADGAEKAAVATAIFGKAGQQLIPMLNQGADGLEAARKEAEALGLIISDETAAAMGDLNDDMQRLKNIGTGVAAQFAQALIPAFEVLVEIAKQATEQGSLWNSVLEFGKQAARELIAVVIALTGVIAQAGKSMATFARAVGQAFKGDFSGAWDTLKEGVQVAKVNLGQLNDQVGRVIEGTSTTTRAAKEAKAELTGMGDAMAKSARSAKAARDQLSDYQKMLQSMTEELRKVQANGDPFAELATDPRFLKMTQDEQAALMALRTEIEATTAANKAAKDAQDAINQARDDADKALIAQRESLRDWADAQKDAIDPTREYIRTLEQLQAAMDAQLITGAEFAKIHELAAQKMEAAANKVDPYKSQIEELKNAMLGFGKNASDTFIDFISGAETSQKSFGEMTASILRDIAKMLVYKNIIEPLFNAIGGGFGGGGGLGSIFSSIFGGARMAGGPVSPGRFYKVNESPFRAEYFTPNTPGRVNSGLDSGSTSVQVNVYITQSGESEDVSADSAEGAELGRRIATVVRQVIATEKRTGGMLAS